MQIFKTSWRFKMGLDIDGINKIKILKGFKGFLNTSKEVEINTDTDTIYIKDITQSEKLYENWVADAGSGTSMSGQGNEQAAQPFTLGNTGAEINCYLQQINIYISYVDGTPPTEVVEIKKADAAHKPTGNALSTGEFTPVGTGWYEVTMDKKIELEIETEYCIVYRSKAGAGDSSNTAGWHWNNATGYTGGTGWESTDGGSTWTAANTYWFKIYAI